MLVDMRDTTQAMIASAFAAETMISGCDVLCSVDF
jgi:hypothetical protein